MFEVGATILAKILSSRSRKSGSRQRLQLLSAQTTASQVQLVRRISCRECMSDWTQNGCPTYCAVCGAVIFCTRCRDFVKAQLGVFPSCSKRLGWNAGNVLSVVTLLICRPQFHRFSSKVPFSACILISPDISGPQSSLSRVAFSRSSALSSSAPFPSLETRLNNENSSWL